jgi:hypothetical protein
MPSPTKPEAQAALAVAVEYVESIPNAPPPTPPPLYQSWVQNKQYAAGTIVAFSDGKLYRAKYANPGYDPTVSTYYWEVHLPIPVTIPTTVPLPVPVPIPVPAASAPTAAQMPVTDRSSYITLLGNPASGSFVLENPWGANGITRGPAANQFESLIGVLPTQGPNGEVAFRLKWRWPIPAPVGTEVKSYSSIIGGRQPGYYSSDALIDGMQVITPQGVVQSVAPTGHTPGTFMPLQLPLPPVKCKFAVSNVVPPTGQGQLVFDIWLQSTPGQTRGFSSAPFTHEIMIPLQNWGNYGAHNKGRNPTWYDHDATIGGRLYHVYCTKKPDGVFDYTFGGQWGAWGTGWKMVAFLPDKLPITAAEIDIGELINYMTTRKDAKGTPWATGKEYLVAVELGVEPIDGTGDIIVYDYKVKL